MDDHSLEFDPQLKGLSIHDWSKRVHAIAAEYGTIQPLGDAHTAYHLQAGPKLLVTFESIERIRGSRLAAEPRGFLYAREEGWSCLTIVSEHLSWFRDPAIYSYFDTLIDNGFFEEFDDVLFCGSMACGYAAAAYSVACPGGRVLAIQPQATLEPRIASFDSRFKSYRRSDFTSRYGFAPEMIDAAMQAYVIYDPMHRIDASHAALFAKRNVTLFHATSLGRDIESAFDGLGTHDEMLLAAMDGELTELTFARLMRARRTHSRYLRRLLQRTLNSGHHQLAANLCVHVLKSGEDAFFQERLNELEADGYLPSRSSNARAAQ